MQFFAADSQYVKVNNSVIPSSGDVTIQVWAYAEEWEYPVTHNGYGNLVAQGNLNYNASNNTGAYFISHEEDSQMRVSHTWSDIPVAFPFSKWVNVAVVKDSNGTNLYLNAQLVASTISTELPSPTGKFFIGTQYTEVREYWNGYIDELSVWSKAIPVDSIQYYMSNPPIENEDGLVGYWNFNQNVDDHSGNGNDGTIYGDPVYSNDVPVLGCTHPNATNYDETANIDDGSCEYETVQIGHQVWMQDNLKATHYRNGDAIATGLDFNAWASTTDGAYAVYDDDPANAEIYGNLYNWYTVDDDRGVCPVDFHVPSDEEFKQLEMELGMSEEEANSTEWRGTDEGSKLAGNSDLWDDGDLVNNSEFGTSGFTGFPAGKRYDFDGAYYHMGHFGYFWSSSEGSSDYAWIRDLGYNFSIVTRYTSSKRTGFSIRCVADEIQTGTILVPEDFPTIQEAIDYSIDGDTILVSAGTYLENINFNGKNIALIGADRETTIIDGGQNGSVVYIYDINSVGAVLSNFTIKNGTGDYNSYSWGSLLYRGGGIFIYNSIVNLDNIVAMNNSAYNFGGGIFIRQSDVDINNALIVNNNIYANYGAGIYAEVNSIVDFVNVTISDNTGLLDDALGVFIDTEINIKNSILISNGAFISFRSSTEVSRLEIDYTNIITDADDVWGDGDVYYGEGNISADPLFTDPENEDFTLQPSSPCIDAGDPASELDPDSTRADMGAYPTYQGCTDSDACNYNPLATVDDDSCAELDPCGVCDGQAECLVLDSDLFGTWQNETNLYYSNSDCSGEGEVMGSDFDDVPDQVGINSDGTMVQMELFEDNICSDVSDCPEMEYMTCLEDGYCASVVYSQWGVNEDTSELWIIYESQYASFSYSLDSNGNLIGNSDGNSDGIECANNDIECCWNFIFNPIIDYCLDLHEGANLISFYALPDDVSITHIMVSIEGNATGVIGQGVAANYNGTEWMGSLNTISSLSGYWVKVSEADSLCIEDGVPTAPTAQYPLHSGANLISFPIEGSVEVSSSLPDDIEGFVSGIIGEGVAANNQPPWQGSLSALSGGNGYWMITTEDISFSFDVSTMSRIKYDDDIGLTAPDNKEIHQSTKQAFYFIESIENIEQGDIIHTYSNGINVGSRLWNGSFTDVPAMGDDGSKFTAGYCINGSIPTFKVEKANGSLITLTGDIPEWSNNQLYMIGYLEESIALPTVYSLSTAYPNPFNPTTTLSFAIPVDSEVYLSVYNLQGREVSTLISGYMDAGYHSIVWNADSYSSGVYFVKMVAGEFVNTQKVLLVK